MKKLTVNFLLDGVIGAAALLAGATGIAFLFLGSGGYRGGRNADFAASFFGLSRATLGDLHDLAGLVMIAGILIHVALHYRWIGCAVRQILGDSFRRRSPEPVCAE